MFELQDLPSYDTLAAFAGPYGNSDLDGLHTWLLWASATSTMMAAFERNLAQHGLAQSQFFALLLLKRNPEGLNVGALAKGISVTSQTMTRLIDRMETADLCGKQADPADRRAWIVRLTGSGEALLAKALPSHYAWVAGLMQHFNPKERSMLKKLMLKLSEPGTVA